MRSQKDIGQEEEGEDRKKGEEEARSRDRGRLLFSFFFCRIVAMQSSTNLTGALESRLHRCTESDGSIRS